MSNRPFVTKWFQDFLAGRLRTPQAIISAAKREMFAMPETRSFPEVNIPADTQHFSAPERLRVGKHYFTDETYLRQMHRADWQHTDPRLMRWAAMVVQDARKAGVPLYIHSAFRTKAQQDEIVSRGASKARWPRSAHNIGEAVDIVHSVFHWDLSPQEWQYLYALGTRALRRLNATLTNDQKLDLNWGGPSSIDDTFKWDPAHWEITTYRSRIRELKANKPVRLTPTAILNRL
jgi:hypothetical protein